MKNARSIWFTIAILGLCGYWLCPPRLWADEQTTTKSRLTEAAEQALLATLAEYQFMQSSVDDVYQWSRRLMDAEQKDGAGDEAVDRHIERMRNLQKKVEALYKTGTRGGSAKAHHATTFYLLEAESMKKPS